MNFIRGEILYDPNFIYLDGGPPCDKLLLVANLIHIFPGDVVIIPCKTNINNYPYTPNCNESLSAFYVADQIGFYNPNTVIQLYQITAIKASTLKSKIDNNIIKRLNKTTSKEELNRIFNCLKKIKDDIPLLIQDLIF